MSARPGWCWLSGLLIAAACAGSIRQTPPPQEPPPPREVPVQLDVPPNAPGEDRHLDVGLFRIGTRQALVAINPGGAIYLATELDVEPAETRLYRLDEAALAPLPPEDAERRQRGLFGTREDEGHAVTGAADGTGMARSVAAQRGRLIVTAWPAGEGQPGRLEVHTEGVGRVAHAVPVPPDLVAAPGCTPIALAIAADPVRVVWLDCPAAAGRATALRLSTLADGLWNHAPANPEVAGMPDEPAEEYGFDARFQGERLVATVVRRRDGEGTLLSFEGGSWSRLATLPEVRVGRPGPPTIVAQGSELLVAWVEPRVAGAQVVLRQARRRRWPLVGRGGVDTSLDTDVIPPAAGWLDGDPVLAVPAHGGLFVLRWDGEEWQRFGGRVDRTHEVTPPVSEVVLAMRAEAPIVAWIAGGNLWLSERGATGWNEQAAPLAEEVRGVAMDSIVGRSAIAWIDVTGTARIETSAVPGRWGGPIGPLGPGVRSIDVAVAARSTWIAIAPEDGGPPRLFSIQASAEDLGSPPDAHVRGDLAVAVGSDGAPTLAWPSPEGVRLAVRAPGGWRALPCDAALALGPTVDAVNLAREPDGSFWIAARQRATSSHVRVVRCTGR